MSKKKTSQVAEITDISDAQPSENEQRRANLSKALAIISKDYGKQALFRYGVQPPKPPRVFSTGSIGLDMALGIGGLPKGAITEIYGPEASGKTTLALQVAAYCQSQGGIAAFIDAEHALSIDYAKALKVNTEDLLISQPDCGEQALGIAIKLMENNAVDLIIIDSVAALVPQAEIDGNVGDSHMGLQARMMSQALRKMSIHLGNNESGPQIIFINQLRSKIGVMFGNPETTTGGNALKFYAGIRLDIRRIGAVKDGTEKQEAPVKSQAAGNRTKVKVVKNKFAAPFKICEFDLIYGQGVDWIGEILDHAVQYDIVDKSGSWYSYAGDKLGQGKVKATEALNSNRSVLNEIKQKIRDVTNG